MSKYDSTQDVNLHKDLVKAKYNYLNILLEKRFENHDNSKFSPEEKKLFDKVTPLLNQSEYGSDEYKANLKLIKPAIEHHYKENSHHPEHYENPFGENGFDLLDFIEMFCDWLAASKRTKDGDFIKSLEINRERFNLPDSLYYMMLYTYERWYK